MCLNHEFIASLATEKFLVLSVGVGFSTPLKQFNNSDLLKAKEYYIER